MDQVNRFSVLCLSPEQVNEQDGDREQQKDSVERRKVEHIEHIAQRSRAQRAQSG